MQNGAEGGENIQYPTLNLEPRTLNLERLTSNIQRGETHDAVGGRGQKPCRVRGRNLPCADDWTEAPNALQAGHAALLLQ